MANELATTSSGTSLIEEYITGADPFSQMAAVFATQGETIKFSKGHWLVGRGHDEVEVNGKTMIADLRVTRDRLALLEGETHRRSTDRPRR